MSEKKEITHDSAAPKKDAKKDPKAPKEEELSEEDQQLKERLELLFERLSDPEHAQRLHALSEIKKDVSGATSSMTSVPKPLKFLSKHYKGLKDIYHSLPASDFKTDFADLVSVIGMVASDEGSNESLKYCLEGGKRNLVEWGHEYLRSLAGEIGQVYEQRMQAGGEADVSDLYQLVETYTV